MQFDSKNGGVPNNAPETATRQPSQDSSSETSSRFKIISLDPNYSDDEQWRRFQIFEKLIDDRFASSHFADARELIKTMIDSCPGTLETIQESENRVVRAFWNEGEFVAYQDAHRMAVKPVLCGLPSLSYLFYLLSCTYSQELRFDLAHTSLLNGYEYEPDHPRLWLAKGNLLYWENRFEEALDCFRTAATIRSWTPPTVVARCIYLQGIALGTLHRLTEARDAFAKALELDPDYVNAKRNLDRVHYELWQLQKLEADSSSLKYLM